MNRRLQTHSSRGGFTIVELLVVIAVIGLLLALILPATMSARGSARRLECQNRLRQFGVALHNFESAHGHLPYELFFPEGSLAATEDVPIQVRLMPYLEQTAAMEKIQRDFQFADEMKLPVFHCPDEEVAVGLSYRGCVGIGLACHEVPPPPNTADLGVWTIRQSKNPLTLSEITDGVSNTAAMSERSISLGPGHGFQPKRDIWYSGAAALKPLGAISPNEAVSVCESLAYVPTTSYQPFAGRKIMYSGMVTCQYSHAAPPNPSFSDCSMHTLNHEPDRSEIISDCGSVISARSNHYDKTVNVLLMDSSVRAVPPQIDLLVWRAAATRAGGDGGF